MDVIILQELQTEGSIPDSDIFARSRQVNHQDVVGALKSLEAGDLITSQVKSKSGLELSAEGRATLERDASPEMVVLKAVPLSSAISQKELQQAVADVFKTGFGAAVAAGWLENEKQGKDVFVKRKPTLAENPQDQIAILVRSFSADSDSLTPEQVELLKKRKMMQTIMTKFFSIEKGPKFTLDRKELCTDITTEMLASESWKSAAFKPYNFVAMGKLPRGGHLHPLLKVRQQFREIFLEMGFEEMKTNNFVESSFWNFDSLFQPQAHPARDMHDTFFMKNPSDCLSIPEDYMKRVKEVHETGGYGSIGYRYNWKLEEAKKNVLRTHTTAVSSRYLYQLGQDFKKTGKFVPKKYFSIDRVFRNEEMDATHLCEFHQVEGLVADYNISLGDMIGLLSEFFKKIGIHELKFKPAYNPYTEPSMEIFGFHPQLARWVEVGNSGVFRPEMLRPMGIPEGVSIIAWGLSLERPTMILYQVRQIRDLVGHKVDIEQTKASPICRLDQTRPTQAVN